MKFTQMANLIHTYMLTNIHFSRCTYICRCIGVLVLMLDLERQCRSICKSSEVLALIFDEEATMRLKYLETGPL